MSELVLVLDFGGQYKELIAGAVRGLSVYSEIRAGSMAADDVKRLNPIGVILTGGPDSVTLPDSPKCDPGLFALGIPVLGICYGMQLMCHMLGGEVSSGGAGEYGRVTVTPADSAQKPFLALMSHSDAVTRLPEGFKATARTASCIAACEDAGRRLCGVQFHPETKHTEGGREILRRFLYELCGASGGYRPEKTAAALIENIRYTVGEQRVLLALSGGVDSSVCAALLSKAVPGRLTCIFVDHGLMRLGEGDEIERVFSSLDLRFIRVNAQERFLARLRGAADPERKRKLIGEEFIRVFEKEAAKLGDIPFLAQGTIYPDIVESGGEYGATIKSHHNVGGLPETLAFTGVIEPLAGLFKDEVRVLGKKLGLPEALVKRQPFPGPGLAIRVMGEVTEEKLEALRAADAIVREELDGARRRPAQYFAVLTDTRSVGVKGDGRTYDYVAAVRAVTTDDFMTCGYAPLPHTVLRRVSSRMTSEIPSISRVVYDVTSKPPGTIEWE
ncbi:MAG: glutamine-hydrolyzing GMP synthase [Oscillospiraceae bacterium]|nr:glutamine-hydrolyzing GMP synthase [Oscillospiraceae bacterium]